MSTYPILDAALSILTEPGTVYEIRIPDAPNNGTVSGYFDDPDKAAAAAAGWSGKAPAIYITLNPVNPALLARAHNRLKTRVKSTTSDRDTTRRRWLLIDVDAIRPAGISSTDAEHDAALERATAIASFLATLGWPPPVTADSGNGAHLLYRTDLPNDDPSRRLIESCLKALALRFDDSVVVVDQTVSNAARIVKLYGTKVCKGDDTAERPHRVARLLDVPDGLHVVTPDQLQALAAMIPQSPPRPAKSGQAGRGDFDLQRWIVDHGLQVTGPFPWEDGWKWKLKECPWNAEHNDDDAVITQRANGAISASCRHSSCKGKDWRALREMYEPGCYDRQPKGNGPAEIPEQPPPRTGEGDIRRQLGIKSLAEIIKTVYPPTKWAIPGILPEGLTLLAGPPKVKKSWLALGISIAIALGGKALGRIDVVKGRVLYLALEDRERRLQKRGLAILPDSHAGPDELDLVTGWKRLDDGGLDALRLYMTQYPATRLIIIDTLAKVRPRKLPGLSDYDADYAAIAMLKGIADAYGICILVITHTRKMDAEDYIDTVMGTHGISGAADGALILKRPRGSNLAVLSITGRDIEEEREVALEWHQPTCSWHLTDDNAAELKMTPERRQIIEILKASPTPLSSKQIAERCHKREMVDKHDKAWKSTFKLLAAMMNDGQLWQTDSKAYTLLCPINAVEPVEPVELVEPVEPVEPHRQAEVPPVPPGSTLGKVEPEVRIFIEETDGYEAELSGSTGSTLEPVEPPALPDGHLDPPVSDNPPDCRDCRHYLEPSIACTELGIGLDYAAPPACGGKYFQQREVQP